MTDECGCPTLIECSHRQKRARYLTKWESSLYEKDSSTASLSLDRLFDSRRWETRRRGCDGVPVPDSSSSSSTSSSSSSQEPVVTFRLEHREGGAQAQHVGEERVLLFRSDRKGAIAKIIFSSSPAAEDGDAERSDSADDRMAQAKIHVLDVKDLYRGFDFGGLLFSEALLALKHRYRNRNTSAAKENEQQRRIPASFVRCHLDAEEDARRHNKLVGFYERLGCTIKPKTRPQFLNNNDGETYRKVPMIIDLALPSGLEEESLADSSKRLTFLPIRLLGSHGKPGKVALSNQRQSTGSHKVDWLMVEDAERRVQFRTTQGLYLTIDPQGQCIKEASPFPGDHQSKFQLLRVSDNNQNVLSGDDDERPESKFTPLTEKELWVLVSPHGSFLKLNPVTFDLEGSRTPTFWQADSNSVSLTSTSDTPSRRQHYRMAWIKQTEDYVQSCKDRYLGFKMAHLSLRDALDLVKVFPGFPFLVDTASRGLSLRNLCFRTAEAARDAGHPDWIQFVALIHALGSVVKCLDIKTAIEAEDDFDWTIACSSRVLGCPSPAGAMFAEFEYLNSGNSGKNDQQQKKSPHGGLQNMNLTWNGPEYLVNMLQHNAVDLPDEAFSVLRLFPLYDWHSKNLYDNFANEDDQEIRPFVVDFDRLRRQARETCLENTELTADECHQLWDSHYAAIASKFGADDILEW